MTNHCPLCESHAEDAHTYKREWENALEREFYANERIAELKVIIEQHRGALGYSVPGHIAEDPNIVCGLCEAKAYQLTAKNAQLAKYKAALESAKQKLKIYRANTNGEYQGGMEYMMLMSLIDAALAEGDANPKQGSE